MQEENLLRLECLKLAGQYAGKAAEVVARAREYADFVLGRKDAEIIRAARDLAEKVNQPS